MIPEIDLKFNEIKQKYGSESISRIEEMMYLNRSDRDPLQKDAKWIIPGLSTTGWLDINQFPQLNDVISILERNSEQIKQEIHSTMKERPLQLNPYEHYLMTKDNWKALYLFKDGKPTIDQGEVPTVRSILSNELKDLMCPLLEMHFSILEPGARIPPHCDLWNFSINLHLAVDIPKDCGIKVANETREWQEGKCLLFDYSYTHEVWNNSGHNRICLLTDIWHPDLTEVEKIALTVFVTEIRKHF